MRETQVRTKSVDQNLVGMNILGHVRERLSLVEVLLTVFSFCWYAVFHLVQSSVRRGSILVSTNLQKLVRFFRMTQKPREGDSRELKSKTFPGGAWPRTPLPACASAARCFGNRSPFILDPRLLPCSFARQYSV